jgi:hypothetical protein
MMHYTHTEPILLMFTTMTLYSDCIMHHKNYYDNLSTRQEMEKTAEREGFYICMVVI